jgi:hypothetical protein
MLEYKSIIQTTIHVQFIGSGPLFLHEGDKVLVFRYNASHNFDATISCRLYYTPARRL